MSERAARDPGDVLLLRLEEDTCVVSGFDFVVVSKGFLPPAVAAFISNSTPVSAATESFIAVSLGRDKDRSLGRSSSEASGNSGFESAADWKATDSMLCDSFGEEAQSPVRTGIDKSAGEFGITGDDAWLLLLLPREAGSSVIELFNIMAVTGSVSTPWSGLGKLTGLHELQVKITKELFW